MHKKERPMLSVTALLYGTTSPTNQLLFNQQQQQQQSSSNSPSPIPGLTSLSPVPSANGNSNGGSLTPIPMTPGTPLSLSGSGTPTGGGNNNNNSLCDTLRYPPNHPLSGSKHLCAICEDRASGKHYGVYSCEGCKGFFKRTVRKDLTYICRDHQNCIVDKRQRNRCQYCRYQKCLEMGMKREAVQEERQRTKPDNEVESSIISTTNVSPVSRQQQFIDLTIDKILTAEQTIDIDYNFPNALSHSKIATKEIELLFHWIRLVPYFSSLPLDDQALLLKEGWNELMIAEISYRSILKGKRDNLVLSNGKVIGMESAQFLGLGEIFERITHELIDKMREMEMEHVELGCLRAIVLFNPAIKNLKDSQMVERLRDRIYSLLETHCKLRYPGKTTRFAKLLVRLPALRSLGLKCGEDLFYKMFQQESNRKEKIDPFINQMLELSMSS